MNRIIEAGVWKLKRYLNVVVKDEIREKISSYLSDNSSEIDIDTESLFLGSDITSVRLTKLLNLCGDNEIALTLFELCMAKYFDVNTSNALSDIGYLRDNRTGIDLVFASQVCGYNSSDIETILLMSDAYDKASKFLYSSDFKVEKYKEPFKVDSCLINWLCGIEKLGDSLEPHATLLSISEIKSNFSKIYGFSEAFMAYGNKVKRFYDDEFAISIIRGERGSGRKSCASAVALCFEKPILFLDYGTVLATEDVRSLLADLMRHCYLLDAIPCFTDVKKSDMIRLLSQELIKKSAFFSTPVIMTCEPDVKLMPFFENVIEYQIDKPDFDQSLEIWERLLSDEKLDGMLDVESIVSRMKLTPQQIYLIVKNAGRYVAESENHTISERELFKICYQILDDSRYENVKRVKAGFTLDDLKISAKNKAILRDVCNQVINSKKVYRTWGMDKKYSYGKCISLLLAGSPGTGKTMAVHCIASELGLELYKVDLSQIADKYIGETQKRLEEVFTNAEKSNMILFFDEADAVLGKRSETKEAHDKYANGEVAFILQRMEEYDGIVVLATNYIQNIDPAFMRRIKYIVNIEKPIENVRKEIWMSAFAENVPRSRDIDFDFLAEHFNIAGGNIKNIVLNATFLAAAEGTPVSMSHMMQAVLYENTKEKRVAFTTDYGKYSYLIRDSIDVSEEENN